VVEANMIKSYRSTSGVTYWRWEGATFVAVWTTAEHRVMRFHFREKRKGN
jgi:hypothetical protein